MLTTEPRVISNAVVRSKGDKATYVGHEINRCKDFSSLHYRLPFEKVLPVHYAFWVFPKFHPFVRDTS